MRGFLAFLGIPVNLKVKVPKTLPPLILADDITQVVEAIAAKQTHKRTRERDLTMLDTAANTGLRRSELAGLRVRAPRLSSVPQT